MFRLTNNFDMVISKKDKAEFKRLLADFQEILIELNNLKNSTVGGK